MKIIRCIRGSLLASLVFSLTASALQTTAVHPAGAHFLQESGTGAPLGKLNVVPEVMAKLCITMVSPIYPQTGGNSTGSTVIVRAVIWKSGSVSPMRAVSGNMSLENQAMNAVRLWRYRPFVRNGEPIDVTTDIRVDFDPRRPGGIVTHPNR